MSVLDDKFRFIALCHRPPHMIDAGPLMTGGTVGLIREFMRLRSLPAGHPEFATLPDLAQHRDCPIMLGRWSGSGSELLKIGCLDIEHGHTAPAWFAVDMLRVVAYARRLIEQTQGYRATELATAVDELRGAATCISENRVKALQSLMRLSSLQIG
jgi:hypothetical protein